MSEELSGPVTLYVKLPVGVTCDQCIVQVGQTDMSQSAVGQNVFESFGTS